MNSLREHYYYLLSSRTCYSHVCLINMSKHVRATRCDIIRRCLHEQGDVARARPRTAAYTLTPCRSWIRQHASLHACSSTVHARFSGRQLHPRVGTGRCQHVRAVHIFCRVQCRGSAHNQIQMSLSTELRHQVSELLIPVSISNSIAHVLFFTTINSPCTCADTSHV